jgi:glycerol kinase
VVRPQIAETTALGAAYAAGMATGVWQDLDELRSHWREGQRWMPAIPVERRETLYASWQKAVQRSLGWV